MATKNYTVGRTGSTAAALLVNFSISGSATYGSTVGTQDYTLSFPAGITGTLTITAGSTTGTGSITIPAGSVSADIILTTTPDTVLEADENVVITITSTVPSRTISPARPASQLVIPNDDFVTVWLSQPSSPIVNTNSGSFQAGSSTLASNTGTAPGNGFATWQTMVATNANGQYINFGSSSLDGGVASRPVLVKFKMRLPAVNPTTAAAIYTVNAVNYYPVLANNISAPVGALGLHLVYSVTGTNASFALLLRNGSGITLQATATTTVPLDSWIDISVEEIGNVWTVYTSGGFSLTANDTFTSNGTFSNGNTTLYVMNGGAVAGVRVTYGQTHSTSFIPITATNL